MVTAMTVLATASQDGLVWNALCWVAPMIAWARAGVIMGYADAHLDSLEQTARIESARTTAQDVESVYLTSSASAMLDSPALIALLRTALSVARTTVCAETANVTATKVSTEVHASF